MIQTLLGMILVVLCIFLFLVLMIFMGTLMYEGYKALKNKTDQMCNKLISLTITGKQFSALCIWKHNKIDHIFECIHAMIDRPDDLYCPRSENFKIKHEEATIIIFGIITNQQLPQAGEQIRKQLFDIYADRTHKGGTVNVV